MFTTDGEGPPASLEFEEKGFEAHCEIEADPFPAEHEEALHITEVAYLLTQRFRFSLWKTFMNALLLFQDISTASFLLHAILYMCWMWTFFYIYIYTRPTQNNPTLYTHNAYTYIYAVPIQLHVALYA